MTGNVSVETASLWDSFMNEPASYVDPNRLVSCFNNAIGEGAAKRMLARGRLRARLSRLVTNHHAVPSPVAAMEDAVDNKIALSGADELAQIALRAGAVYWANALSGIISGPVAIAVRDALGPDLLAFALSNRDLAGTERVLNQPAGLRERLETDGWRCVVAWCDEMPASIGKRVLLKLPPSELIDGIAEATFLSIGPKIVRRCAE